MTSHDLAGQWSSRGIAGGEPDKSFLEFYYALVDALSAEVPPVHAMSHKPIQYGLNVRLSNDSKASLYFKDGGFLSTSVPPPQNMKDPMRSIFLRLVASHPGATHFDGRERIKCDWEATLAKLHLRTGHPLPDACGDTMDDPAGAIEFIGTIDEVRPSGGSGGGEISGVAGASGPSGESQEIGRRCEELAFQWLCALYGPSRVEERSPSLVSVTRRDKIIHEIERLNEPFEQGKHWDLEERDSQSSRIYRRYEVKAPAARLTASQAECAREYGDDYWVLRVDPSTGKVGRVRPDLQQKIPLHATPKSNDSLVVPHATFASERALGNRYHEQLSKWRSFAPRAVGRGRSSCVELFILPRTAVLDQKDAKSTICHRARSRNGAARLARGLDDPLVQKSVQSLSLPSDKCLVVTAKTLTGERALVMALQSALRDVARLLHHPRSVESGESHRNAQR
jgi:Domain of unknown function (DUF3883)